jgi:hypothetical protein
VVPGPVGTVTVSPNPELTTESAVSYRPVAFTSGGAPVYDLSKGKVACPQTQAPTSTGGGQVLATEDDWTILTTGPKPFASQSLAGAEHGTPKRSYPSYPSEAELTPQLWGRLRLVGDVENPK